jgi:hypothetical protein
MFKSEQKIDIEQEKKVRSELVAAHVHKTPEHPDSPYLREAIGGALAAINAILVIALSGNCQN